MTHFAGTHLIVETDAILESHKADGREEHDGQYIIALILGINDHTVADLIVHYPSIGERDVEFARLTAQVKVDEDVSQQHIAERRARHLHREDDDIEWDDEDDC